MNPDHLLAPAQLIAEVEKLRRLIDESAALYIAHEDAGKKLRYNLAEQVTARAILGRHTKAKGVDEIVVLDGIAAFVPMPPQGYGSDYEVHPTFCRVVR